MPAAKKTSTPNTPRAPRKTVVVKLPVSDTQKPTSAMQVTEVLGSSTANQVNVTLAPTEAVPSKLRDVPDWKVWETRPVIRLRHAISLVHNIHTSGATFERLKEKKDSRTKKFNVDLNTLRTRLPFETSLPTVRPLTNKATNDTEIYLSDFVEWIRAKSPFDGLKIPAEFFNLKPPRPGFGPLSTATGSGTDANAHLSAASSNDGAGGKLEFVGKEKKTVARILLALVVAHYCYRPRAAEQERVFAPIANLCLSLGLSGPKDWETVKSVLAHATSALDEREIDMLIAKLDADGTMQTPGKSS